MIALGVPQTYPPRPVNGEMVSDFLTPSIDSRYTYPEALKDEIREVVGDYMVDVRLPHRRPRAGRARHPRR